MCDNCYAYIYDTLLSPLSTNHLLSGFINENALRKCSHDITTCVTRSLQEFIKDQDLISQFKLFSETYKKNAKILSIIMDTPEHTGLSEHEHDKCIWNKFKDTEPLKFSELNYAIQICMENMVVKKIKHKEEYLEQFFMFKLRLLIENLPDIHREHTEKKKYSNGSSLGSVPQEKLNYIRRKAGLPVKEDMYDIYDLYN